jgi:hypothetical protein
MRRSPIASTFVMLGCGVALIGCLGQAPDRSQPAPRLANAEPSAEQLIDKFLGALARKDPSALRNLRVTEAEYRDVLMAGTVPEGQPLKPPSKELGDFAWGLVDTKSRYYEQSLLAEYGGKPLRRKSVAYGDGEKRFANHSVRRQLRLILENEVDGREVELGTGSIVEVGGRYKFASFVRD